MAYVKTDTDKTIKEEEAQGGQKVELTAAPSAPDSGTSGPGEATVAGEAPGANKQFVSSQERAQANIGASQRLADKILKPFEGFSEAGERSIIQRGQEFKGETSAGVLRDEGLIQKGLADASSLNFAEQQKFKDIRKGTYQGPEALGKFSGAIDEESKIRALGDLLSTREGLEAATTRTLPTGNAGGKYTSGMRRFDVGLLQQTPEIQAQIRAEQERAGELEAMRGDYQARALADILGARQTATSEGQDVFRRAEQVGAEHEQSVASRVAQRKLDVVQRDKVLQARIANRQNLSDEQLGDLYGRKGSVEIGIGPNGQRISTGVTHGDVAGQRKAYNDMLNLSRTKGYDLVNIGRPTFKEHAPREGIKEYQYTTPSYEYQERGRDQFDTTNLGSGARRGQNYRQRNLTPADIEARDILTPEEFARYNALKELSGGEASYQDIDSIDTQSQIQDITAYNQYTDQDAYRFRARNDKAPTAWNRTDNTARRTYVEGGGPSGGRSTISKILDPIGLCLGTGTMITMIDGTFKAVETLQLGDELYLGGAVTGIGSAYSEDMYEYKDNKMSGSHAVLEDGVWLRVRDSELSTKLDEMGVIHPMACVDHIYVTENGMISADTATSNLTDVGDEKIIELNETIGDVTQAKAA